MTGQIERNGTHRDDVEGVETVLSEWSSSRYLSGQAADESAALQRMIEDAAAEGPTRIKWDSGEVAITSTVRPTTSGTTVIIEGGSGASIDATNVPDGNDCVDLQDADNVRLEDVDVNGSTGAGLGDLLQLGARCWVGGGVLDGGQRAINVPPGSDGCRIGPLTVRNQHDTDSGWAAAVHAGGIVENLLIRGLDISDCDRGVEIDDGPRDVRVRDCVATDIDNSQASNPGQSFGFDVHSHTGADPCENVVFENCRISESLRGFSATDQGPGLSGVKFRDCVAKAIQQGAAFSADGDVLIDSPRVEQSDSDGANIGIVVKGGNVTVRDPTVETPSFFGIQVNGSGGNQPLGKLVIDSPEIEGTTSGGTVVTSHGIELASVPAGRVVIRDADVSGCDFNSVRGEGGNLNVGQRSVEMYGNEFAGDVSIADSNNDPVLLFGGKVGGAITLPTGSSQEYVV